jgi:predicted acylesterase/phospholipase RssA
MEENRIAIVMEGGGSKGAFSAGVAKALKEELGEKLKFGAAAGSSVGGLNIVMIMADEIKRLVEIWENLSKSKVCRFSLSSLAKQQGFYSTEPLRKFLEENLTEKIFRKLKGKRIFITGLNFQTNRLVIYDNFPNRLALINALMVTSAIPGIFESQRDDKGDLLVDGGLLYPLPFRILIERGYKKILAVIHEPLILEDWTRFPQLAIEKEAVGLKNFLNRLIELVTSNLTKKAIEKYFLAKCFEEKLKELLEKISPFIQDVQLKKKIAQEFAKVSFPYQVEMLIIFPPIKIHDVLDFSQVSIRKAMDLGYNMTKARMAEIKKFFEE